MVIDYFGMTLERNLKTSLRAFGGGSLMIWAAIGWNGKSELSGRQDSHKYKDVLNKYLLPFTNRIAGVETIFQ